MNDASNPIDEQDPLSRRIFLQKSGSIVAGLAGLFGLANATGLVGNTKNKKTYGSSAYGGKKDV